MVKVQYVLSKRTNWKCFLTTTQNIRGGPFDSFWLRGGCFQKKHSASILVPKENLCQWQVQTLSFSRFFLSFTQHKRDLGPSPRSTTAWDKTNAKKAFYTEKNCLHTSPRKKNLIHAYTKSLPQSIVSFHSVATRIRRYIFFKSVCDQKRSCLVVCEFDKTCL